MKRKIRRKNQTTQTKNDNRKKNNKSYENESKIQKIQNKK